MISIITSSYQLRIIKKRTTKSSLFSIAGLQSSIRILIDVQRPLLHSLSETLQTATPKRTSISALRTILSPSLDKGALTGRKWCDRKLIPRSQLRPSYSEHFRKRAEGQRIATHCKQGRNSPKSRHCSSNGNVCLWGQKGEGTISGNSTNGRQEQQVRST